MYFNCKLKIIQLVLLICLITFSTEFSLNKKNTKPRRKLIEKYAQKFVDYFDLENYLSSFEISQASKTADEQAETEYYEGCSSLEEIKDYFFDVYSSFSNNNMSGADLEHLIEYLVTRYPKNEEIQQKTREHKCARKKCFQSREITEFIGSNYIDYNLFSEICPAMLFNFEISYCEYDHGKKGLSGTQIWLMGLLLSGIVTIWSWNGAIVFPIIQKKFYKRMLTFMISLAFGCLTSNSLLKYVPLADGFEILYLEETNHSYFFKHLVILAIIFFFFMFERSMKIFTIYRTRKYMRKQRLQERSLSTISENVSSSNILYRQESISDSMFPESETNLTTQEETYSKNNLKKKMNKYKSKNEKKRALKKEMSIEIADVNFIGVQSLNQVTDKLANRINAEKELEEIYESEKNIRNQKPKKICCTSLTQDLNKVKPVGWMAIFGDGLGNFIDGLSIGASINQGLVLGLTTALATWCGNIPQELGDFALLVRAGMSPFQALFYNFLSGNSAYIGCIIGIVFGSNIEAARWIFSISGAATMYLGIGVLLPEMNEEFEDGNEPLKEKLKITFIQVFGILFGFSIMIILNMYEDEITF